jgi:ABC-type phosphate/phosphonate transport system substrate-binding protein
MYDGGELTSANDQLWSVIAERLRAYGVRGVPPALDRDRALDDLWSSGRLLLGQICGYPFAARFRDRLRVLAAPQYAAPGCAGATHRSYLVVHTRSGARDLSALRGARAVINDDESMTGRHLLGDAVHDCSDARPFFDRVVVSGSHARSLAMVADGAADVAAVDCVSYTHLARTAPEIADRTRVLHRTVATPTLPLVISQECGESTALLVARAVADAFDDPRTKEPRHRLRLVRIVPVDADVYLPTVAIAARADHVFGSQAQRAPGASPFRSSRVEGGAKR